MKRKIFSIICFIIAAFSVGYFLTACSIIDKVLGVYPMIYKANNDFGDGYISNEFDYKVGKKYKFKVMNEQEEPIIFFGLYPSENGEAQAEVYAMATSKETSIDYMSYCACKIYIRNGLNKEIELAYYMAATHKLYKDYNGSEYFKIEKGQIYFITIEFINIGEGKCMFFANNSLSI